MSQTKVQVRKTHIRIGKVNAVFGRLDNVWKYNRLGINSHSSMRHWSIYNAIYLGNQETMTVTNMKLLEDAHHK